MTFLEIAEPLLKRNLSLTPLKPRTKIAFLPDWEKNVITTLEEAKRIQEIHGAELNCGIVALPKLGGVCIFEVDNPDVQKQIYTQTGHWLPKTFTIKSRAGRGHFYFKHTLASIELGNLKGLSPDKKEAWSFRAINRYCVSPGSLHPDTGEPYEVKNDAEIIDIPDWLLDWMKANSQKLIKKVDASTEIIEGDRNNSLASIAGKLRRGNLELPEIEAALLAANERLCHPTLPEDEVRTIARSISRYPVEQDRTVTFQGRLPGEASVTVEEEPVVIPVTPYPKFPAWIMEGTSIYEGFVKPLADKNSRYPEFMFYPALVLLLNYLGTKLSLAHNPRLIPSIFLVCIGRRGKVIKSTCVEDAIDYLHVAGITSHSNMNMRNAEGQSLVWTAGSPEGLGLQMAKLNCRNAVLFYDELAALTNKAGIESSNLNSSLLTLYESGKFSNSIKSSKDSFSLDPKTYCASLIACSTDKNFGAHWSRLAGKSSGLNDRFSFLLQPETLKELEPYEYVNTDLGAAETRKRVDAAIKQSVFAIPDRSLIREMAKRTDNNRASFRAEKIALGLAVDLGLSEVEDTCVERALALVEYEQQVKKKLILAEATTREGSIQQDVRFMLQNNSGKMLTRELERRCHASRHGTTLWGQVYGGLMRNGIIREQGTGKPGDPKFTVLLQAIEEDDD